MLSTRNSKRNRADNKLESGMETAMTASTYHVCLMSARLSSEGTRVQDNTSQAFCMLLLLKHRRAAGEGEGTGGVDTMGP